MDKRLIASLAMVLAGISVSSSHAGIITLNSNPPTLGTYDQSQLVTGSGATNLDNNATKLESGRPSQGQTFTVPADVGAGGANLQSFSLFLNNWGGGNRTFTAHVTSITGGSAPAGGFIARTILATDSASFNSTTGGWLTFTFDAAQRPLLNASTTYGFEIITSSSGFGDLSFNADTSYTGGRGYTVDVGSTNAYGRGGDRQFVANLVLIPEPTSVALAGSMVGMLLMRRQRA